MIYNLDGINYTVLIQRKNNKNIYIRLKDDGNIYVTCNYLTTNRSILKLLDDNQDFLRKSVNRVKSKKKDQGKLLYLGKSYDIIYDSVENVRVLDYAIVSRDKEMLDKWYKEEMIRIFDERYVKIFNHFDENIKSPILKIRLMKTRWGVYNKKNHSITLNAKLIEFDLEKIDYVIVHELCHIIYFDHSKSFWNLVSKYVPDYKRIRKEMR